jgi:hypothetical protein
MIVAIPCDGTSAKQRNLLELGILNSDPLDQGFTVNQQKIITEIAKSLVVP